MKESRFYKFSLLLPLAVPALTAPLTFGSFQLPLWLAWTVFFTTYSGFFGGPPYIVLVGLLFWWARRKSDIQFKRALILLPLFMLPVVAVFLVLGLLVEAWLRPESAAPALDMLRMLLTLVPFVLGFGYFYVLLVFGMVRVLKRMGMVAPSPAI